MRGFHFRPDQGFNLGIIFLGAEYRYLFCKTAVDQDGSGFGTVLNPPNIGPSNQDRLSCLSQKPCSIFSDVYHHNEYIGKKKKKNNKGNDIKSINLSISSSISFKLAQALQNIIVSLNQQIPASQNGEQIYRLLHFEFMRKYVFQVFF